MINVNFCYIIFGGGKAKYQNEKLEFLNIAVSAQKFDCHKIEKM